jgi:hypothetical protein
MGKKGAVGKDGHRNGGDFFYLPDEISDGNVQCRFPRAGESDDVDLLTGIDGFFDLSKNRFLGIKFLPPDRFFGGFSQLTINAIEGAGFERKNIDPQGKAQSSGGNRAVDVENSIFFARFFHPFSHRVFVDFDEAMQRPIVCFLYLIGKKTGWKFFHAPVILNAIAADPFSAAGFPGAIAFLKIDGFLAFFHGSLRR